MRSIFIENPNLRVGVTPDYGARVVSFIDKLSGREWIAQGSESANTGEDAVYLGDEAVGWDECFPTVSPCDASATAWGRRLRDHGDLWGRPWRVDAASAETLALSYADRQFRFSRELSLRGAALVASYAVENLSGEPLPYLWALHALLAVTPGDRIELPGVDKVRATYLTLGGAMRSIPELGWAGRSDPLPFSLDEVQPATAAFAGKFFASGLRSARVGRPGQWLEIGWDNSIEDLGIWLTYGGWPAPGGHQEAALEPTSSSADDLGDAIAAGAVPLAPGERRNWRVTLTLAG